MCERCEKPQEEQVQEISAEELQAILGSSKPGEDVETVTLFFEPLELSTENLVEDELFQFDKAEFHRGLKEGSFVAGMYTALINAGLSMEDAVSCIVNDTTYKMNVKLAEINSKASIESSKNAVVVAEKNQL